MSLKINYKGLYKAQNRDRKIRKRQRLNMTEDGRSVKLLNKIIQEKSEHANMERLPTDLPSVRTTDNF
jgi:hypothetical protein